MKYVLLFVVTLLYYTDSAFSQDGKTLYNRNCNACHTIGGGKKVGPDLKGVTNKRDLDWLVKFIKSSKDLIASGDADANAIFNEFGKTPMPSHSMSTAEIQSILNFIAAGGDKSTTETGTKTDSLSEIFKPSADIGFKLFTGEISLKNGGASCISCHSVRDSKVRYSGTFAKDLSVSYVEGVIETMLSSMPAMISTYKDHELTLQEKSHLELYLKTVKENQIFSHAADSGGMFLVYGLIAFIIILLIINIFWKHTKKLGVKDDVYKRQLKTK